MEKVKKIKKNSGGTSQAEMLYTFLRRFLWCRRRFWFWHFHFSFSFFYCRFRFGDHCGFWFWNWRFWLGDSRFWLSYRRLWFTDFWFWFFWFWFWFLGFWLWLFYSWFRLDLCRLWFCSLFGDLKQQSEWFRYEQRHSGHTESQRFASVLEAKQKQ